MNSATKPLLTGGCQCGAIRFALSAPPLKVSICHCRMCQKAVGAPFASFADIDRGDFTWTRGKPAAFRSSFFAERDFCADCGTPLRRPADRNHDRRIRPSRPGDPDPAVRFRITPRLGGGDRQPAEPDHTAE